jgi:hypothetical protein
MTTSAAHPASRSGLLTGQDIAIGVAPQHLGPRQPPQPPEHLRRARAEQDQVAQDPPPVDPAAGRVLRHGS